MYHYVSEDAAQISSNPFSQVVGTVISFSLQVENQNSGMSKATVHSANNKGI